MKLALVLAVLSFTVFTDEVLASSIEVGKPTDITVHDEAEGVASPRILSHSSGKSGGFQIAFVIKNINSGYLNVGSDMKSGWRRDRPVLDGTGIVIESDDGGYWGVGFGALLRIGKNGEVRWERLFTEASEHQIYCGAETKDGLVLVGSSTARYQNKDGRDESFTVPWLEMVDKKGKLLWQKAVPEEHDSILSGAGSQRTCSNLAVASNGTITWALVVKRIELEQEGEKRLVPTNYHYGVGHDARFLVQFGPQGNEIRRSVEDVADIKSEFLFAVD